MKIVKHLVVDDLTKLLCNTVSQADTIWQYGTFDNLKFIIGFS